MYDFFKDQADKDMALSDDEGLNYLAIIIEEIRTQFNKAVNREVFEAYLYRSYPESDDRTDSFGKDIPVRCTKSMTITWRPQLDTNTQHKHIEMISIEWTSIEMIVAIDIRSDDPNASSSGISTRSSNTYRRRQNNEIVCREKFDVSKRLDIRKSIMSLYKLIQTWERQDAPIRRRRDLAYAVVTAFPSALDDALIGDTDDGEEIPK